MELAVDLVLIAIGVLTVLRSWRRGALVAGAVAIGWIVGLWVGLAFAPAIVSWVTQMGWVSPAWRTISVAIAVLLCAGICNALIVMVASTIHRAIRHLPVASGLDAVGGGLIGLLTWAVVVWLLAGFVQTTSFLPLTQIASSSRVVQTLNAVAPVPTAQVLGRLDDAFSAAGLPRVFEGDESIPAVGAPNPNVPASLAKASASVVEVLADEPRCGTESTGSGWVLSADRVVTNAHVVAGASTASVRVGGRGAALPATVVAYDPEVDLAVLQVPGLAVRPLAVGGAVSTGNQVYVAGYPGGGPYDVQPGRVRALLKATGKDIYNAKTVTRLVYSLRAIVRPGNSGGPLLDASGRVAGVVFARSLSDSDTGYALTMQQVEPDLKASARAHTPVSTGACTTQ